MSIVKMKKIKVIAMADKADLLLDGLMRIGCVEITDQSDKLSDAQWSATMSKRMSDRLLSIKEKQGYLKLDLESIKKYQPGGDGLFVKRSEIDVEKFLGSELADEAKTIGMSMEKPLDTMDYLVTQAQKIKSQMLGLMPWKDMNKELECTSTEYTVIKTGTLPASSDLQLLSAELAQSVPASELVCVSADKQLKYMIAICMKDDEEEMMQYLRTKNFSVVTFPEYKGTAAQNIADLQAELAENEKQQHEVLEVLQGYSKHKELFRIYQDRLNSEEYKEESGQRMLTDGTVVYFEGWTPASSTEKVEKLLQDMECAYELTDPSEDDIPNVPVRLENNFLTKPLNMVTEMYSLPSYGNLDPNPLMAPFFILFYGIMMADMGYGILMMAAGLLITKKYKPKGTAGNLFGLAFYCGISTFIFGALTGGFFGDFIPQLCRLINPASTFELPALFSPLNDTVMVLVGGMALGFVHIVTGMAISVYLKFKRKQYLDAFFGEITWWIVFAGLALMLLKITNIVLYIGCALVVAGPLIQGKGLGKLTGVFSSIYSNVTGYFGDILSYSRLMALMLAGSVIASVFNTLGSVFGNVVVYVIIAMVGNLLNFGLNLLGCYVHDLRLQCLEFFNKFYEDGGKPFKPIDINTKFVDVR